ncbi:hypothetical protein AB6A40_008848 [Gnathostoma spinigerum]|uniref:Uncharacterized protein n=1 Tax=Gnathostoma spinigerum TaxID=75299 RepID=A0ABD6EQ91_9BILA
MHAASMTQHKIPQVSQMSHTAIPQYSGIADHSTTQPPIYDGPSVLRSPVVSSSYTASASLQAFPTTSNDISSTGTPMTVAQSSTTNSTFPQSFHPSSAPHNTSFGPHFPQTSQNFTSAAQMLPNGAAYTQPCLPPTSLQSSFVPTGNPPNMTTFPQLYTTASKQNSPYVHSGQCEPLNVLPPPPAAQFIPPQPFQPHPQPNEVKHSIHPQYQSHSGSQLPRSGMYPGGMGSMQKEFTHVDTAAHNQQRRFVDLLQERNIRQCGGEDVSVTLPHTVANPDVHCDPNIFRCTLCAIPQTQELLEKSRLPFGLTLHPFRDMKNLHIISTSTIVRCRCCQTYINPYVYFPDDQHWKCNICYRVNDLPSDFLWDPSKKEFGEPTARPEIQYSTVEFIAPSEYMLRPPQPACYLFVLDVSQNAIENGYLYAFSKQLLNAIGLLPGDDRTLIGFIAFDTAVHFFQFFSDQPPKQLIVDDFSGKYLTKILYILRQYCQET